MRVFIDWDDTIFNTRDFVTDFSTVFTDNGVPFDMYKKTRQNAYRVLGDDTAIYDMEMHLSSIASQKIVFDTDAVRKSAAVFLQDTSRYVFPDIRLFFERAREKNIRVYVLSFGQSAFQNEKINGTGLREYFDEVFIVQEKKYVPIVLVMERSGDEPVWFFDDRAEYIDDVKKNIPAVKTVQVMRSEGRYQDVQSPSADFMIQDFDAIVKVLSA
ncbi:MAG: HAD family hydrolase [Candidatus Moranbacteria bacterium]|nr:HAD family hydrolase [Candidatus Moranbacteria bacterium]